MKRCCWILLIILTTKCRDAYNVTPAGNVSGALIVEGIINANGRTRITLSRATTLSDKRIDPEIGSLMLIESENGGTTYPMAETANGVYESADNVLSQDNRYRIHITTFDNREYASEFKSIITSPPIDSISWKQEDGGVRMFVNGRNDANTTTFYKWDYEEAWEFHSAYRSVLVFEQAPPDDSGNVLRLAYYDPDHQGRFDEAKFRCYNNRNSTAINVVSTANLGQNVLYYPVRFIDRGAIELSVLYSIKVNQYSLSSEGYEFFTRMKKNTEQLGSIFDAQPSEITGNVKCISNPGELVIGYVEVSTLESKRIFINNDSLDNWNYDQGCQKYFDPTGYPYPNDRSRFANIIERGLLPTLPVKTEFGAIITFEVEPLGCVDCRLRGTSVKPDFWP